MEASALTSKSAIAQLVRHGSANDWSPVRNLVDVQKVKPSGPGVMGFTSTILPGGDVPHFYYCCPHHIPCGTHQREKARDDHDQ